MTLFEAVVLGLVQGLTEFIPVSSSGHLIIARELLGLQSAEGLAVDAVLQLATTLAVFLFFRKEIFSLARTAFNLLARRSVESTQKILLYAIVLGTIPAVLLGLLLEDTMETLFRSPTLVAWMLIAGGILFIAAEFVLKSYERRHVALTDAVTPHQGFIIGCFQALALIPGLSRSGMTISGGLFLGLTRVEAARFGFLLSFPIILGSGLKKFGELGSSGLLEGLGLSLFVAAFAACVSGIFAIRFMLEFLKSNSLVSFAIYRFALAAVVFLYVV